MLYYNKKILGDAGINGPPKSWDELVADAAKVHNASHAGFCARSTVGSPSWFPGAMMLQYFLPYSSQNMASFLDDKWHPLLTTPEAFAMASTYQNLLKQYGPKGIASYGFQECEHDFQQGKLAFFLDASDFSGEILDPSKSTVVDQVGFATIPCPANNSAHCTLTAPWGIFINQNGKHSAAGWKLIQWLSSKDIQTKSVKDGQFAPAVTRNSVLTALSGSKQLPTDLANALQQGYSTVDPLAFPQIPEVFDVLNPLSVALSKILSGQASSTKAFTDANSQMTDILKKAGYIT